VDLATSRYRLRAGGVHAIGVEGSVALTERGQENARRNGLGALASFFSADLYTDQEAAMGRVPAVSKMLIDPPRDGAVDVCKLLTREARPELKRVVYISCSPSTLARDADTMVNVNGFRLTAAGVVNMFPHTAYRTPRTSNRSRCSNAIRTIDALSYSLAVIAPHP